MDRTVIKSHVLIKVSDSNTEILSLGDDSLVMLELAPDFIHALEKGLNSRFGPN